MTSICIIYYSNFKGAPEQLAEAIARGTTTVAYTTAHLIRIEDVDQHWATLHAADAIVFSSPTCMGSVAAGFKVFIEQLAGEVWLRRRWVNKVASGFTVSGERCGDKLNTLQQMVVLAGQMGMSWVPVRITGGHYSTQGSEDDLNSLAGSIGVMVQANIDEPVSLAPPSSDICTAELHGNHIANVACQFAHGRRAFPADNDEFADQASSDQSAPASLADLMSGEAVPDGTA